MEIFKAALNLAARPMTQDKAENFLVSLVQGTLTGLLVLYIGQKVMPMMVLDISPEASEKAASVLADKLEPLVTAARKMR